MAVVWRALVGPPKTYLLLRLQQLLLEVKGSMSNGSFVPALRTFYLQRFPKFVLLRIPLPFGMDRSSWKRS